MQGELVLESQGVEDEEAAAAQALREKAKKPWDQLTPQEQVEVMEEVLKRVGLKE